jgi:aspartate/glutamate racemase
MKRIGLIGGMSWESSPDAQKLNCSFSVTISMFRIFQRLDSTRPLQSTSR